MNSKLFVSKSSSGSTFFWSCEFLKCCRSRPFAFGCHFVSESKIKFIHYRIYRCRHNNRLSFFQVYIFRIFWISPSVCAKNPRFTFNLFLLNFVSETFESHRQFSFVINFEFSFFLCNFTIVQNTFLISSSVDLRLKIPEFRQREKSYSTISSFRFC